MVDFRTRHLGLQLEHPLVASAGPISKDVGGVRRLEDGGAAAVVMFSLFEEQLRRDAATFDHLLAAGSDSFGESLSYFPDVGELRVGPDGYLELLRKAREGVRVPVIASLNGTTAEGWIDYARQLEQAGASAIELNVYQVAADPDVDGRQIEDRTVEVLRAVKRTVRIPVAVKLGPFYSAFANMARRLDEAGADGLVLFNRFYQPDFDVERREVVPTLELSSAGEVRLPLLWLAVLSGRLRCSLAASTGVQGPTEVLKYLMAGADVVMTTGSLLRHGPGHLRTLLEGTRTWLDANGYSSVDVVRGSMSQRKVADPNAFERANYIRVLESFREPRTR